MSPFRSLRKFLSRSRRRSSPPSSDSHASQNTSASGSSSTYSLVEARSRVDAQQTVDVSSHPVEPSSSTQVLPISDTLHARRSCQTASNAATAGGLPARLWMKAYNEIKEGSPELVKAYELLLLRVLGSTTDNHAYDDTASVEATKARMAQLVEVGLKKTERIVNLTRKVLDVVLSVANLVGKALQRTPELSPALVGVFVLLQILENQGEESMSNRDGLVYVVSRIDWYWNLSSLLLEQKQDGLAVLQDELEKHIVILYKEFLLYQMKSVCTCYRNQIAVFIRDTIRLDQWAVTLRSLQDAEDTVQHDIDTYVSLEIRLSLNDIAKQAEHRHTQLQGIQQAIQENTKKQEEVRQNDMDRKCLSDLLLSDPRIDKQRIEDTKGGVFPGASHWILEHESFRRWHDSDDAKLLWIKGDPGKGKTMLLITIVDALERQLAPPDSYPRSSSNTSALSYFFCQGTNQDLNRASAVLRGLLYVLGVRYPQLVSHLRESYDRAESKLFENDENAFFALSKILEKMLQDDSLARVYIVVDALDECIHGRDRLLKLIVHLARECRAKWLVSSRNTDEVERHLEAECTDMKLSLEITQNAEQVSRAVNAYIDFKTSKLRSLKNNELRTRVRDIMREKANGTFLWVALVAEELEKTRSWRVLQVVESIPASLHGLYDRMLAQIQPPEGEDWNIYQPVLATVTLTYRPLHLLELGELSGLPPDISTNLEDMREVVVSCGSFLTIKDDFVYVIHQSVKDHLIGKAAEQTFPNGPAQVHQTIFLRSIQALSGGPLRRNIYAIPHPGVLIDNVDIPSPDPLATVRYACIHWVSHFCEAIAGTGDVNSEQSHKNDREVSTFIQKHFLHWLEALSLLRAIPDTVLSVTKLESVLKDQSPQCPLFELIRDARRFILHNEWVIENAPLQTYLSALIFTPTQSVIRVMFSEELPSWISTLPNVESTWSPCLQVLEAQRFSVLSTSPRLSVAFSKDSKLLASGSYCSIKIWNVELGREIHNLQGHSDSVTSMVFSRDSKILVSGSRDRTIRLWDVTSGREIRTLRGHKRDIWSIALLEDSESIIASGSEDCTIKIWTVAAEGEIRTLRGHISPIRAVAFSRSGFLASGSEDNTIKLWNVTTGEEIRTLRGHSDKVCSIAFSASGLLASGSHDRTVKVWNVITGEEIWSLDGHSDWVLSVAFSNSELLASGSEDRTVRIWDATKGRQIRKLHGHTDSVSSVAFSDVSGVLASASADQTVKIWDITMDNIHTFKGHDDVVYSIALSKDSKNLVSGSHDRTAKIWNATSGKEIWTLQAHSHTVRSVSLSEESDLVASGSWDGTVKIWNVTTGKEIRTLRGHNFPLLSVRFSENAQLLASGDVAGLVNVWDVTTGQVVQTLRHHEGEGWVLCVVFSRDSRLLASGSSDQTVKLWDVKTGGEIWTLEDHDNWIDSVAFSHNSKFLASTSLDKTVKIWDVTNGKRIGTLEIGTPALGTISFDSTDSGLFTSLGAIRLDDMFSGANSTDVRPQASCQKISQFWGYGLNTDWTWVTWNGNDLLWLPPDYRPFCSTIAGMRLALGCISGKVIIFEFSGPPSLF